MLRHPFHRHTVISKYLLILNSCWYLPFPACPENPRFPSFRRKPESGDFRAFRTPAFSGLTKSRNIRYQNHHVGLRSVIEPAEIRYSDLLWLSEIQRGHVLRNSHFILLFLRKRYKIWQNAEAALFPKFSVLSNADLKKNNLLINQQVIKTHILIRKCSDRKQLLRWQVVLPTETQRGESPLSGGQQNQIPPYCQRHSETGRSGERILNRFTVWTRIHRIYGLTGIRKSCKSFNPVNSGSDRLTSTRIYVRFDAVWTLICLIALIFCLCLNQMNQSSDKGLQTNPLNNYKDLCKIWCCLNSASASSVTMICLIALIFCLCLNQMNQKNQSSDKGILRREFMA